MLFSFCNLKWLLPCNFAFVIDQEFVEIPFNIIGMYGVVKESLFWSKTVGYNVALWLWKQKILKKCCSKLAKLFKPLFIRSPTANSAR